MQDLTGSPDILGKLKESERLVHIHIPKSGGSSINDALAPGVHAYSYSRVKARALTEREKTRIGEAKYVFGHLSVADLEAAGVALGSAFTVLRHPVDRCISWYRHTQEGLRVLGRKTTPRAFFSSLEPIVVQNCRNRACFQLADHASAEVRSLTPGQALEKAKENLGKFRFVLDFSKLKEHARAYLGIRRLPHRRKSSLSHRPVGPGVRALIRRLNREDMELYRYFKGLS